MGTFIGSYQEGIVRERVGRIVASPNSAEREAQARCFASYVNAHWYGFLRTVPENESDKLDILLLELVNSDSKSHRLAGIAAVRAMLTGVTNESRRSHFLRTCIALKTLEMHPILNSGDAETLEASTDLLLAFSKELGTHVRRFVKKSLENALSDLIAPHDVGPDGLRLYFNVRMARNCLIVSKIGPLFLHEVLGDGAMNAIRAAANLVSNELLRAYGVTCVISILSMCAQIDEAEESSNAPWLFLNAAYDEVRKLFRQSLNASLLTASSTPSRDVPRVLGSIELIEKLLGCSSIAPFLASIDIAGGANEKFSFELGVYLLEYTRCSNLKVQSATAVGLTALAKFEPQIFCRSQFKKQSFAKQTFAVLCGRAGNAILGSAARAEAICAAGEIAVTLGPELFRPYVEKSLCLAIDLLSELQRGSRHCDGRGVEHSGDSLPAVSAAEAASPPLPTVLDFARCIAGAATPRDPALVSRCNILFQKMLYFDPSISLTNALGAFMEVVKEKEAFIQHTVMHKVASVFLEEKKCSGGEVVASEERHSDAATTRQKGVSGTRGADRIRNGGHHRSGIFLEDRFTPSLPEYTEPGYLTAHSGLDRQFGRAQTEFQTQEVELYLKLPMDPTLGQLSANWSSSNKAMPRMALKILASFDFSTVAADRLAWFANQFVIPYLDLPSDVDRMLAVQANANLLKFAARQQSDLFGFRDKIFMVISQLALVAVVDPSRRVRLACLVAITEQDFELFLAQPEILICLGQCLHDEDMKVRGQALKLVCSLHEHNCEEAEQFLRRFLCHLLSVLQVEAERFACVRSEASRLLQMLIRNCREFVKMYSIAIGDVLLTCLKRQLAIFSQINFGDTLPIVEAIGDVTSILTFKLDSGYIRTLAPLLLTAVLDVGATTSHPEFRIASLRALSRVAQNISLRFKPLDIDGRLFATLVSNLRSEMDANVRKETLHLLGVIGAFDPYREEVKDAALHYGDGGTDEADGAADGAVGPVMREIHARAPAMPAGTPLVPNTARGVGPAWAEIKMAANVPIWRQQSICTHSLVNLLEHPFTDSDLYVLSVVLDSLFEIVGQARHAPQHVTAVDSIVLITGVIKEANRCSYFLPFIVPRLLWMLQPVNPGGNLPISSSSERIFVSLADLVAIVKCDFEAYLPDTISLCNSYLTDANLTYRLSAVGPITILVKVLARELEFSFRPYAAHIMSALVSAMMMDMAPGGRVASSVLSTIVAFGRLYRRYSCIILPALIEVAENTRFTPAVRLQTCLAIESVLSVYADIQDLAPSVLHPLIRILAKAGEHMSDDERNAFCFARAASRAIRAVALKAPAEFALFVPVVAKALRASGLPRARFESKGLEAVLLESNFDVAAEILGYSPLGPPAEKQLIAALHAAFKDALIAIEGEHVPNQRHPSEGKVVPLELHIDLPVLLRAFEICVNAEGAEWTQWMENLSVSLLHASVDPALRFVWQIGEQIPHLARQLFNPAFLSCWPILETLDAPQLDSILEAIKSGLQSETIPLDIKQALLDLCEFMDHDERPLPICRDILTEAAVAVGAFAKALRYKEIDYIACESTEDYVKAVASDVGIIEIYQILGHTVSAAGTLEDFSQCVEDKSVVRGVELQYGETLTALPEALDRYQTVSNALRVDVDFSTVGVDSEYRGRELFKKRRFPSNSDNTPLSLVAVEAGLPDDERDLSWFLSLSQLRMLDNLGQWHDMEDMAQDVWTRTPENKVAQHSLAIRGRACSVAFDLSKDLTVLDRFRERVNALDGTGSWDAHFYKTLLCIRTGQDEGQVNSNLLEDATAEISKARDIVDKGLISRAAEGYPRAYGAFLNIQHLVELEEIVAVWRSGRPASEMKRFKTLWDNRLNESRGDQRTWYRLLMIRSLLLDPSDDKKNWIEFAKMCRKDRRLPMEREVLQMLLRDIIDKGRADAEGGAERLAKLDLVEMLVLGDNDKLPSAKEWSSESLMAISDRAVQFACIKHMWAAKEHASAFQALRECAASSLVAALDPRHSCGASSGMFQSNDVELQAEIFLKLAKWSDRLLPHQNNSESGSQLSSREESLYYAKKAIEWRPSWFKAWHCWAALHENEAAKALRRLENQPDVNAYSGRFLYCDARLPPLSDDIVARLSCAIDGYFKSVGFGGKTGLEDVLTLLSLWFQFGSHARLRKVFMHGFDHSEPEKWLEAMPQIVARLHTSHPLHRQDIVRLLTRVGLSHPQAAVYPLTVAANTPRGTKAQDNRRTSAAQILSKMRTRHKDIVDQAATLAAELNRVATLEYELWYEQIEEAHKLCLDERNLSRMLEALRPLHDDMAKRDAATKCEQDFRTAYGNDLKAADDLGREYLVGKRGLQTSGCDNPAEEARLEVLADQVLRQYTAVRERIQKQQIPMHALQLGYVSPFLAQRMAFRLEIPGSYRPRDKNPVTISCFEEGLDIVQIKQRPRKLYMWGDNGKRYGFLLKGGDDLRQDERVMQIFGLMNQAFVQSDERSVRKGGDIKRFNIVPLSSKAGLVELVPQCITMTELVQNFRQARNILPDIENKAMRRMAREPERLTLFQRVDLFRCMLETTDGRDIARILWLSSRNSEMWLEKRTHFSRTVATTSMAGYILGLGDRHPSNIMIEKDTGKVMHIDFGDCFEIAMQRRQYPETVPFRLTRMMVHALEPCGTGGHFRHMAVAIMRILRHQNMRTAVLSMMEAFIYDPLAKQSSVGDRDLSRASQTADDDLSEGLTVIANERAEAAFGRVLEKLTGTDFDDTDEPLSAEEQVDRLVEQATNVENLCVLFSGYMSCW